MPAPARLVVAAACPTCGAPLDFTEGATTARCRHCGSSLLLTGRGQVLAFSVTPRLDATQAMAAAPRPGEARLYFLPYYRFTAEEFCWKTPAPAPGERTKPIDRAAAPLELDEGRIERNFLACALDGLGLYSLGVRPGVLRLSLFRPEAVRALGQVVAADLAPDAALARALRPAEPERVVHRAVLGGLLSLVYYPYWTVELLGERLAVIDAVSGAIATTDASVALRARLERAESAPRATVEFRPLVCPNCGWDLPVDAGLVVLFCPTCARAWEVGADRLRPVTASVVSLPPRIDARTVRDLPVWLVTVTGGGRLPARFVVPAFRYRGLHLLLALAMRLTRATSVLEPAPAAGRRIEGAHLDRDDAIALARVIATGLDRRATPALTVCDATLAWLPFAVADGALREPRTGFALPASGLPDGGVRSTPADPL